MAKPSLSMQRHPDIMALREQSEQAAASPMAQAVEALSVLSGLYLAASPWIVGFSGFTTLSVNNLITGLALTVLAIGFGSAYERTHGIAGRCRNRHLDNHRPLGGGRKRRNHIHDRQQCGRGSRGAGLRPRYGGLGRSTTPPVRRGTVRGLGGRFAASHQPSVSR